MVDELYHPGYIAKRMEIGAVVGAVPEANVRREQPVPGDVVILQMCIRDSTITFRL